MPLFSRKSNRKNSKKDSYTTTEKFLRASQHSSERPSEHFKTKLFRELQTEASSQTSNPKLMESKPQRSWFKILVPVVAGVATLAIVAYGALTYSNVSPTQPLGQIVIEQPANPLEVDGLFELVALTTSDKGIDPNTSFELRTTAEITADKIKESLSFSPKIAYAVEKSDDETYLITPENELEDGTILSATMSVAFAADDGTEHPHEYSWAYEVESVFQVVSTLPRHTGTNVGRDTGVEIEFSHVGFTGAEDAFSIVPETAGRFETHRKTLVFVPDAPLAAESLYTVRLESDVTLPSTGETLAEDLVFQFETDVENREDYGNEPISMSQKTLESSSAEKPVLLVGGDTVRSASEVDLSLYSFPSAAAFEASFNELNAIPYWASRARKNWSTDTSALTLHSTTAVPVEDIGTYRNYAITAPDTLAEGFYLAAATDSTSATSQALLIVTDIVAYSSISETQLVVWAHDAQTAQPLSGASVTLSDGTALGTTNASGIMSATTPTALLRDIEESLDTLKITEGGRALYLPLSGNSQNTTTYSNKINRVQSYWSYIYVDQPIYKPSDSVNFWGVVEQRDAGTLPDVEIQLIQRSYAYEISGNQTKVIAKQSVTPGTYGTFEGSIALDNLTPGYYDLMIVVDGEIVTSTDVDIQTYTKPAYSLSIDPETYGVITGDAFTHTISADFYSGAPVANVGLFADGIELTTNENGKAHLSQTYSTEESRRDSTEWITIEPSVSEEGEIIANATIRVFPGTKIMDASSSSEGLTGTISGTLHQLDLEGYNLGEYGRYGKPLGERIPNDVLHLTATRGWYTRQENGTRYDFIQKKVVPKYTYTYNEEAAFEQDLTTDRSGAFSTSFEMIEDSWYTVDIRAIDDGGRSIITTVYAYPSLGYAGYENNTFRIKFDDAESLYSTAKQFSLDETVSVGLYRDETLLPATDDPSFLFIQARDGIRNTIASASPSYSFTFSEEHVPNVVLQGVWFDGRSYWQAEANTGVFERGASASFKEEDRELSIDITTDKDTYEPGDEVTMDIDVKQPDGSGTEAVVNVNLVDEAVYAVRDEDIDFNASFYQDVVSGIYSSYGSHRYPIEAAGAEGGGGGERLRQNFPDKALFETVETDRSGRARITFTLPDNLTSWRVTSHAIDEDRYAGSSDALLTVNQEFFVNAVIAEEYTVSDDPTVKVRTFGEGISEETEVQLTISSETLPLAPTNITTTGFTAVDVSLPDLTAGAHTLKIEAKAGEHKDAILRTFDVVPSRIAVPVAETAAVIVGWSPDVDAERSVDVLFTDKHVGQFYPRLTNHAYTFGDRLDQMAAKIIARELLNEYFGESYAIPYLDAETYQLDETGAITLLPYSDHDLALSANIAASSIADSFSSSGLADYFESVVNDSSQTTLRHAQSLYGLAALREPVLTEIREVLDSDKITDVDRLYLALGLAELGDFDGAEAIYNSLLTTYGQTVDTYMYLTLGATRDEHLENTSLAAVLAAHIQNTFADSLYNYVQDNRADETVLLLQELAFIETRMRVLPTSPVTMSVEHLGQTETIELEKGKVASYALTPSAMESFRVTRVTGSATAIVKYVRAATPAEVNLDPTLSVSRSYESDVIGEGDLLKVTVNFNIPTSAPDGLYQITDFVPSGMKIVTEPYRRNRWRSDSDLRYPYLIDGQRLSFSAYKGGDTTFTYYVRVVTKGTYTADAPVLQSMNAPSVRMGGSETTITIR